MKAKRNATVPLETATTCFAPVSFESEDSKRAPCATSADPTRIDTVPKVVGAG